MRTTIENRETVVKFDPVKIIKAAVGSARLEGYKGKIEDFIADESTTPAPEEAQRPTRP